MKTLLNQNRRRFSGKASSRGFTIIEIAVVLGLVLLLGSLGYLAYDKVRASGRASVCATNLSTIYTAKRTAWNLLESLASDPAPDDTVISYMDQGQLTVCPDPGTHHPAAGNAVSVANLKASYAIDAANETTPPTCLINPTAHYKR